jgi:hypothetical protein
MTTSTHQMIATHPVSTARESLVEALQATADCAQVCSICADACLSEPTVANLTRCITINLDCATICDATTIVLSRQSMDQPSVLSAQLKACMEACRVCAEECERHAGMMEHCRVCAAECRRCERACRELLDQI